MITWLFCPGHEERKARKAVASDADHAILDWEDAVPAGEKAAAREVTVGLLEQLDPPARQRLVVRVNHPASDHYAADAAALEGLPVGHVMVPKVEAPEELGTVAELENPMVAILESARGIERASEIARAHPLLRYLAFGPLDLLADLRGQWTPEGTEHLYARSCVALVARSARLAGALDGPWPRLEDDDGLRRDTELGRRIGYSGRMLVHPRQIPIVRDAYRPSEEDLAFARKVMAAAKEGEEGGRGALRVDGRFIDGPVIRWAEQVLARGT